MKRLVIFDLDGTLLNTIADLGESTNFALQELGYPTYDIPSYRFRVGNGINKLFERSLPEGEKSEENVLRMRKIFIEHYNIHCADGTRPYDGIPALLSNLQKKKIMIAVASNKYQAATSKLIHHFFRDIHFIAIQGQQEGRKVKPDPSIVTDIIQKAKVTTQDVLYVGDSGVDMQTANNSHVTSCGVTWGFRPIEELKAYQPNYIVNQTEEIMELASSL